MSLAIRTPRTRATEKGFLTRGAEKGTDGEWERGQVGGDQKAHGGGAGHRDLSEHKHVLLQSWVI